MNRQDLLLDALSLPSDAITYAVSQRLAALCPDKGIVEANAGSFGLEEYARAGHCHLTEKSGPHPQIITEWEGVGRGLSEAAENAWLEVSWQERTLEVILLSRQEEFSKARYCWILADLKEIAETFFLTVCEWNAEVRGEVLVFEQGCWCKSEELFRAIKSATFDNLVLGGTLKEEIREDFSRFFSMRDVYERYGIPWKRGVLLIGSPGNGKTHTVKALINTIGQPCLYVKSFKSRHGNDHANIRAVFARARQTTPCVLVLEDLDSLIDGGNRSFFLNELDGFAANTGIVVLATTNHPERLDPAILERPSRFDRKYQFPLPALSERRSYIDKWNTAMETDLRLTSGGAAQVAEMTEGYSFAYLKELWLSSMMRWIVNPQPGGMDTLMPTQVAFLREQMQAVSLGSDRDAVMADDDLEE